MSQENHALFAGVVGLAAATVSAGGTYLIRRRLGGRSPERSSERLEIAVVDALRADEVAGACLIDVAVLRPGLIELSGRVPDQDAAGRAAEVAQRVAGVHTVVNRLTAEQVERKLEVTRRRHDQGYPELRASGWEGMRSGMGARRQGEQTDPDRGDDSASMKEDAIGLDGPVG